MQNLWRNVKLKHSRTHMQNYEKDVEMKKPASGFAKQKNILFVYGKIMRNEKMAKLKGLVE